MMNSLLRWLLLIPCAIAGVLLSNFLLHFILYQSLKEIVQPYPETPERLLTPLVSSGTFVYISYLMAPKQKMLTSIIFAVLIVLFCFSLIIISLSGGTWFGNKLTLMYSGMAVILSFVGAFIGLLFCAKKLALSDDIE